MDIESRILILIGLAYGIISLIWHFIKEKKNDLASENSVIVTVVKVDDRNRIFSRAGAIINISGQWDVTFKFECGKQKKFSVPEVESRKLQKGQSGILILQGTRFISFKKTE